MTILQTLTAIRALGLTARRTHCGEFRISFPGPGSEPSAYYTEDPEDAIGAAEYMAESQRAMS